MIAGSTVANLLAEPALVTGARLRAGQGASRPITRSLETGSWVSREAVGGAPLPALRSQAKEAWESQEWIQNARSEIRPWRKRPKKAENGTSGAHFGSWSIHT